MVDFRKRHRSCRRWYFSCGKPIPFRFVAGTSDLIRKQVDECASAAGKYYLCAVGCNFGNSTEKSAYGKPSMTFYKKCEGKRDFIYVDIEHLKVR